MKRNLWPRRLAIPSVVLATAGALLGTGFASPGRESAPRAMNILLMGTDERNTITAAEKREFHAGGHPAAARTSSCWSTSPPAGTASA